MKKKIEEGGDQSMADLTLYSVQDVAKLFNESPVTILRDCRANKLPYVKKGRKYYFPKAVIEKWIRENTVMPECSSTSSKVG